MRYLATLLAALGIFLCLAGSIGVWYLDSQLDRARRKVCESVGEALSSIDKRLVQTQSLVAKSTITVAEIREGAQQWARDEARESLAARTNVDVKLQHLIKALHQATHAVEISNETVLHIGQGLEVVNALGFSTNVNCSPHCSRDWRM